MPNLSRALACASLVAALASSPVLAQDQFWLASPDDHLQDMRGGFAVAPGLVVSFGILRTVDINGAVVASTSFHIDDLRNITAAQQQQLARAAAGLVVQNGAGNVFTVAPGALAALVVQNSLNNQKIRTTTQIDAVTNGMTLLKNLNITQTLNDALAAAVRH
jgi:hypothetical protein